jgi:hypothetical protein
MQVLPSVSNVASTKTARSLTLLVRLSGTGLPLPEHAASGARRDSYQVSLTGSPAMIRLRDTVGMTRLSKPGSTMPPRSAD